MWAKENRPIYNRDHLRYPSDLTDEEWSLIEPLIPPAKSGVKLVDPENVSELIRLLHEEAKAI